MIVRKQRAQRLNATVRTLLGGIAIAVLALGPLSLFSQAGADDPSSDRPKTNSQYSSKKYELEFSGKDYVVIPKLKYNGGHPITLEAFATPFPRKPEPVRSSVVANLQLAGVGLHFKYKYFMFHVNDGRTQNYGYASVASDTTAELNKSVHVAGVFDGKNLSLYLNGKLQKQTAATIREFKKSPFAFMVGADPNGKGRPHQFFVGRIDEVRISKVVRYSKNFEPIRRFKTDKNTLVLYHFDEGKGTLAKDASGNGRDGVIHGAKWIKEDAPMERDRAPEDSPEDPVPARPSPAPNGRTDKPSKLPE